METSDGIKKPSIWIDTHLIQICNVVDESMNFCLGTWLAGNFPNSHMWKALRPERLRSQRFLSRVLSCDLWGRLDAQSVFAPHPQELQQHTDSVQIIQLGLKDGDYFDQVWTFNMSSCPNNCNGHGRCDFSQCVCEPPWPHSQTPGSLPRDCWSPWACSMQMPCQECKLIPIQCFNVFQYIFNTIINAFSNEIRYRSCNFNEYYYLKFDLMADPFLTPGTGQTAPCGSVRVQFATLTPQRRMPWCWSPVCFWYVWFIHFHEVR